MRFARTASIVVLGSALVVPTTAATAAPATPSGTVAVPVPSAAVSPAASVNTGPSRWRGAALRHPSGGAFSSSVTRWANLVRAVMREHRIKRNRLPGILAQIQQESGGNPRAVNLWDSNAAAGHPSKGLLQIIAPTYRAYAKPGYRSLRFQTVPYTNVWASLHYVIHTYGRSKFLLWNRGHNQAY